MKLSMFASQSLGGTSIPGTKIQCQNCDKDEKIVTKFKIRHFNSTQDFYDVCTHGYSKRFWFS